MTRARASLAQTMALAFALAVCAACAGSANTAAPAPPDPKTQMAALEERIFALIQDARRKIDPAEKELALDSELVGVARQRSQDMAAKNYIGHQGPDGETSATLVMDKDVDFQGLLGENIAAQHFTQQGGVDVEAFAQRFVQTWLDSPEHRENLSFEGYDRSGVGAAVSGDTVYVTQLFATDLGLPKHVANAGARQVVSLDHPKAEGKAPPPPSLRGAIIPVPVARPTAQNATP